MDLARGNRTAVTLPIGYTVPSLGATSAACGVSHSEIFLKLFLKGAASAAPYQARGEWTYHWNHQTGNIAAKAATT